MASVDPAVPNSQIPQKISRKTVEQAVNSLLRWRSSKLQGEKSILFGPDDDFVYLILTLKKVPSKSSINQYSILLPHSLTSEFSESCLIIDDRSKSGISKEDAQKKIKAEGIPISDVLKISKLKSDYQAFDAKRKLCNSYNLFFADRRVIPLLPGLIGRKSFRKKRIPLALDLTRKNWKEQIEKACRSSLLFLSTGTCSVVKVARASMEKHEIVENVVAAMDGIVEVVPKKWKNVRSFHLKLLESLSLPIYQSLPDYTLKIASANVKEDGLNEEGGEVNGDEVKKDRKVSKKKGRIHEARYMDDIIDDALDEDDFDDDNDADFKEKEDGGEGRGVMVKKKTERGKKHRIVPMGMDGLKRMKSAKDNSDDGGKKKGGKTMTKENKVG